MKKDGGIYSLMKSTPKKKSNTNKSNRKEDEKSHKRIDKFIKILFITSIILIIWEIVIFRETIIPVTPLLIIATLISLITTPITFKFLLKNDADLKPPNDEKSFNKINKKPSIIILCYFFLNWIVCGGLPVTAFILSNYYFAEKTTTEVTVKVSNMGKLNGRNKTNYTDVIFPDGTKKELFPPRHVYEHWDIDSNQTIFIKKGLWGYYVMQWSSTDKK